MEPENPLNRCFRIKNKTGLLAYPFYDAFPSRSSGQWHFAAKHLGGLTVARQLTILT